MKPLSILVRAECDAEARVWVATSTDIVGLAVEAATVEELEPKVTAAIDDLVELNAIVFPHGDIPVHIMAEQLSKVPNPLP